jgi:hypothetical protein
MAHTSNRIELLHLILKLHFIAHCLLPAPTRHMYEGEPSCHPICPVVIPFFPLLDLKHGNLYPTGQAGNDLCPIQPVTKITYYINILEHVLLLEPEVDTAGICQKVRTAVNKCQYDSCHIDIYILYTK